MNDTRRTRAALGALLLVSLALITADYHRGDDSPLHGLRTFGAAVFGPLERGAAAVVNPVGDAIAAVVDSPTAHHRITTLKRKNQRLRARLRARRLDGDRARRLDRLLTTAGLGGYRIVAARVISAGHGLEETVSVDVGRGDGIKPNMTVLTGTGLVGRVTRVGPTTSTVLLATDAASSVGGRLEGSKEIGVVHGSGRRGRLGDGASMSFRLLDSNEPLRPGQRIVTFGSQGGRPYVPGVPIGTVTKVKRTPGSLTRTALVRPFVHFGSLDMVGVVVAPPERDPRDSVLPPRPTPSATARPSGAPSAKHGGTPSAKPSGKPGGVGG